MWIDDDVLRRMNEPIALSTWVPEAPVVVMGSSNQAAVECCVEACTSDGVEILRRYGGGGTVVLHHGCVVVSLGAWVQQAFHNDRYFKMINDALIETLAERWPVLADLHQAGISDLVFGDRKVAGTSLFRSRNYLLYQASLLVDVELDLIERYLAHPSREPAYRARRGHGAFLTGLSKIAADCRPSSVVAQIQGNLEASLRRHLGDERADPMPEQFLALQERLNRAAASASS